MIKLPKLSKNAIIEVTWKDSNYSSGKICDVGYFREYAKGFIILCCGHVEDKEDEVKNLSYINAIPVECISEIKVLRK